MNKSAVALAADSAATFMQGTTVKVFDTAEKLFCLNYGAPVGIMINDSPQFMGVPWEIIVKAYRRERRGTKPQLKDYADDFLAWLRSSPFCSDETIDHNFNFLATSILRQVQPRSEQKAASPEQPPNEIIAANLDHQLALIRQSPFFDNFSEVDRQPLVERYRENVKGIVGNVLPEVTAHPDLAEKALELVTEYMVRRLKVGKTGLVFSGFGDTEIFPSLVAFGIEFAVFPGKLRAEMTHTASVGVHNAANITPFAQAEMVASFLTGADPRYVVTAKKSFAGLLRKFGQTIAGSLPNLSPEERQKLTESATQAAAEMSKQLHQQLENHSRKTHTEPIMTAVGQLPKDQLAVMAESLISLTSFRRKMSHDVETVGGAIDVAVISKGDGFVWIKRKHYFDASLNPQYFERLKKQLN